MVQLHPSGQRLAVTGEQTIVEALNLAGIDTETACGIGGTCQARVVRGIPDHRDNYLTPAEKEQNNRILLCCSRARAPEIVIELQD
ncbi:MAG: 2Fe-2S iron-sulfur cluster-binding protein [Sodalis sp. (in: enterobacteria)]|uniref:2Fe-2S iron-sulfur cluster-binding protein n=1 Tax=Sodalis sp. (in: enterobacteria) TaxID=1898979 RepID=UPI0039E616A9